MKSLFPGIDPFVESQGFWPDFHASFIIYWRDALNERLPEQYEVRIDERVNVINLPEDKRKRMEPDLALERHEGNGAPLSDTGGVATMAPVTIPLLIEEEQRETYIEILHRPNRTLVAILELLSPANKEEPGRNAYLAKRNALINQPVHLVEIDFLIKGQRPPLAREYPPGQLFALIARADRRPDCDVYAWTLRDPVPAIPIPLRSPDADVLLPLAEIFQQTYERGRYRRDIDYTNRTGLALNEADWQWVEEVVKGA
jgi:hypothetical protein